MDSSLLASIQKGAKLKKAVTNDRSAPTVTGGVLGEAGKSSANRAAAGGGGSSASSAAPKLAGPLFAGGMPKLRSVSGIRKDEEPVVAKKAPPPPPMMMPKVAPAMNRAAPPPPPPAPSAAAIPKRTSVASRVPPPPPPPAAAPTQDLRSVTNGIKSMSINNQKTESSPSGSSSVNGNVPFSVANLRKTFANQAPPSNAPKPPAPAPTPTWKQSAPAPVRPPVVNKPPPPPVVNRPPPPPAPPAQRASMAAAAAAIPIQSITKETCLADSVTGIESTNGRWKFPGEDEIPAPRDFENTQKYYPSGNSTGCTVEPSPIKMAAPPPPPPTMEGASTRSPLRQNPIMAAKAATSKPSTSKADSLSLLEAKLASLSAGLSNAVANEDFEICAELRNRIKKGRALKEDIVAGFVISEKEIDAI